MVSSGKKYNIQCRYFLYVYIWHWVGRRIRVVAAHLTHYRSFFLHTVMEREQEKQTGRDRDRPGYHDITTPRAAMEVTKDRVMSSRQSDVTPYSPSSPAAAVAQAMDLVLANRARKQGMTPPRRHNHQAPATPQRTESNPRSPTDSRVPSPGQPAVFEGVARGHGMSSPQNSPSRDGSHGNPKSPSASQDNPRHNHPLHSPPSPQQPARPHRFTSFMVNDILSPPKPTSTPPPPLHGAAPLSVTSHPPLMTSQIHPGALLCSPFKLCGVRGLTVSRPPHAGNLPSRPDEPHLNVDDTDDEGKY